ncbi:uncharacterized protein A1O5_12305 [Cladophialophora psammophila CBS 110553]|uniref:Cytochrome P450 oxidoreductase n=1 Tax=Cladophialophora psammophila CBS 110553 TaxID=1182543 RepID=W9WLW2_9EURO|nr:uncharacterized protein A1O5_12305 [Cladophialophora psammophila CBS 110553]EXJ59424.1 hypothetical protein A1O5_12305 [Cladophialophora psammophila CBS 110553]
METGTESDRVHALSLVSQFGERMTAILSANILLSAFLVFLCYLLHVRYNTALRAVPGPLLASFTRLWKVKTILTARQELVLLELHRKHGKSHLVRIGPNEISVSDPGALKVIYGAGTKFTKTSWYPSWSMGGQSGKYDVFSDPTTEGHAASKRMVSHSYSMAAVNELDLFVQRPVDRLLQRFGEHTDGGTPMNLADWLQWFAFDVIGEVSFSKQFGFLDAGKDIDDTLKAIDETLWSGIVIAELPELDRIRKSSLFKYLPVVGGYDQRLNIIIGQAQQVLSERRRGREVDRRDLLSRFFQVQRENPGKFDDLDLQVTITVNIFAGSDTTSIALRAILYYAITNPRCYDKLLLELDEAVRSGRISKQTTLAEAQSLPYLQACIKEAMRLHPSLGTQHTRYVPEGGVVLAGTYLPARTTVGINSWVMHSQTAIFGPDADQYRPERWIDGDKSLMDRHFMSFGYGAHMCLGKNIALLEINKVIPQILLHYHLRLAHPEDGGWSCTSHTFVQQRKFHVIVERRKQ